MGRTIKEMMAVIGLVAIAVLVSKSVVSAEPAEATARQIRFAIAPQSTLMLYGNSTLHKFSFEAQKIAGELTVATDSMRKNPLEAVVNDRQGQVSIPVVQLKSGEKGLDKNMRKAMEAKKYPEITFTLKDIQNVEESDSAGNWKTMQAQGLLEISGTENQITLDIRGTQVSDTKLRFTGQTNLRMTDYGIEPPTMRLGAIKTENKMKITFNIIIESNQSLALSLGE